jgi:hypothetical protein
VRDALKRCHGFRPSDFGGHDLRDVKTSKKTMVYRGMTNSCYSQLADHALLAEAHRLVDHERHATAQLIALLIELDARRLYLREGYSSLFSYCTQALHLSEHAAYNRIATARAARRFPVIIDMLADGSINLTTVTVLAAELTTENHREVLEAARHRSKIDSGLPDQADELAKVVGKLLPAGPP